MTENRPTEPRIIANDYRSLLGEEAWINLHPHIRHRFSLEYLHQPVTYTGIMDVVYLSPAGKLLAQVCRLIGTPLALHSASDVQMRVDVYPDTKRGGIAWARHYLYRDFKPDRVVSTKRIYPVRGLVELVGAGFGMYLSVSVVDRAIVFRSSGYFWRLGKMKITLPDFLSPGNTTVMQKAFDDGRFQFTLDVDHPLLGKVCQQRGIFSELIPLKLKGPLIFNRPPL
jgi:hypothetical protein